MGQGATGGAGAFLNSTNQFVLQSADALAVVVGKPPNELSHPSFENIPIPLQFKQILQFKMKHSQRPPSQLDFTNTVSVHVCRNSTVCSRMFSRLKANGLEASRPIAQSNCL